MLYVDVMYGTVFSGNCSFSIIFVFFGVASWLSLSLGVRVACAKEGPVMMVEAHTLEIRGRPVSALLYATAEIYFHLVPCAIFCLKLEPRVLSFVCAQYSEAHTVAVLLHVITYCTKFSGVRFERDGSSRTSVLANTVRKVGFSSPHSTQRVTSHGNFVTIWGSDFFFPGVGRRPLPRPPR